MLLNQLGFEASLCTNQEKMNSKTLVIKNDDGKIGNGDIKREIVKRGDKIICN